MFCDQSPPLYRHGSEHCRPGGLHVVDGLRAEHPGPVAGLDDIEHVGPADEGPDVGDEDHAGVGQLVRQLGQRVEESPASTVSQSTVAQASLALSQVEMTAGSLLVSLILSGTSTRPQPHLQHHQDSQVSWTESCVVKNLKYNIPACLSPP